MSLVGVDLNTTLAQRKERRAASVPKSRPQSARAPRSSSPSVYAQRSGSRSQRGPRQPPRMEEPLLEAVAAVEAAQADAAPPPAPRPKPFADTPSRLFEGTKSQTRRVVELTRERQPSPQKRSSSAGPRRPRSAQIPTPARLPNPLQRHVNPPPPRALQSLSGGDVDAVIPMNGNERRQLTVTKSPSGRYSGNPLERIELRKFDPYSNIDYVAGNRDGVAAPDNDRRMKESSWLTSQAFVESLRAYPPKTPPNGSRSQSPLKAGIHQAMDGAMLFSRYAFSGNTHSPANPPLEHLETAVRRRCGIASADPGWMPGQLPFIWSTSTSAWTEKGPYAMVSSEADWERRPGL